MSASPPSSRAGRGCPHAWVERLARAGYLAKAVVYGLVGATAVWSALGSGGRVGGLRRALAFVDGGAGAEALLAVIALGLTAYALWRLVAALSDSEDKGIRASGLLKRSGYALSGIVYAGLAWYAVLLILDEPTLGAPSERSGPQDWAALVLALPVGRLALGAAGLVAIGFGLAQLRIAILALFREKLDLDGLTPRTRAWALASGRLGIAARAAVLGISGGFAVKAALESDAADARGFAGVMRELGVPAWHGLLGAVGLGLMVYAAYCLVQARYRRVGRPGRDRVQDDGG